MSNDTKKDHKLRLKKPTGWFPAGEEFLNAMSLLSDGAFKLFVFLCLNADRQTATYAASPGRLAAVIGKSRHTAEAYTAELQEKGICLTSRVPYLRTTFRINDEYWPYQCSHNNLEHNAVNKNNGTSYVEAVRRLFLSLGCTSGRFAKSEERQAQEFERRKVPLTLLEDAMVIGACRKYVSWLNHGSSAPIASLQYFDSLVQETRERPFPPGYREYMRLELQKLSERWAEFQAKEVIDTKTMDSSPQPEAEVSEVEHYEKETG